MKIKYFITADNTTNDSFTGKLGVSGFFDRFQNIIYPAESPKFFIIIGMMQVEKESGIKVDIELPDGTILTSANLPINSMSVNDTVNSILAFDKMPLPVQGLYPVKIYNNENNSLIDTFYLNVDYPPKRNFSSEEIEEILSKPDAVKSSRFGFKCPTCGKDYRFELFLDPNSKVSEGYEPFPKDNLVRCCDGQEIDITGVRRQIEWLYGTKLNKMENQQIL